ncbi:hypothetical protein JTE90_002055 [Oedothorax gibbosus]|uniref:FYVE-type zinc finger domain-containing protein n=1 Tax=Oedothorax gibbosus TaxID=931172 RepID=A0AAV6UDF8_9ARAC|nr:hypothetical protein JTE90_002055 [Oedothorax gibbosus]
MGKSDVPSISTFECRTVLDSIQNEFDQLQKEDVSLSKLQQDLTELVAQRNILVKRKGFNDKYCVLCCSAFNLLFKRKLQCQECPFLVCRSCSVWDFSDKKWLCTVCEKQKILHEASREWICTRMKTSFGNFGAVKALQNFWRNRRISDSEDDSGYEATGELPLMKLLSSHSLNRDMKMTDCEEDEEELGDEEELAEIQYSIETILEGLLGGTLDDALVDQLYPSSTIYLDLFTTYHVQLVEAIQNLSKALQKALHNLPADNGLTPTTTHAALKNIISELVEDCQEVPPLQGENEKEHDSIVTKPFDFTDVFSSYDSLVATAVINKVVEESQTKFKILNRVPSDSNFKTENGEDLGKLVDITNETDVYENVEPVAAAFDMPVECVQIEEIEEITQEFTDSEDDKLSSISKWSNSLQSSDDVMVQNKQRSSDLDIPFDVDHLASSPTPFPEFGCDLVDDPTSPDSGVALKSTVVTTWEENWLFKKKKRLPLYSNLRYQLLTYCDEPPSMLIPCPSECTDVLEQEDLSSELSENQSAGSLDFSSESADTSLECQNPSTTNIVLSSAMAKSEKLTHSSPIKVRSEEKFEMKKNEQCREKDQKDGGLAASFTNFTQLPKTLNEPMPISQNLNEAHLEEKLNQKAVTKKESEPKSVNIKSKISPKEWENENDSVISTPPRPGTIAEREHQKWLNAVPLKHNPYSAENISRRSTYKTRPGEPAGSFEEFERKLSVSSETSDPGPNKVNCGPKSIDSELYKRDYYINQENEHFGDLYPIQKSAKYVHSGPDDCFEPLSEEALNSFEEKIYVKSGKVFTLENRVRRLEREIKDSQTSPNLSRTNTPISPDSEKFYAQVMNGKSHNALSKESSMPNAQHTISPVSTDSVQVFPVHRTNLSAMSNKNDQEKMKKNKPCRKVHSLTARSLSREFRDMVKSNGPKQMNRTIQVPSEETTNEHDSLRSPESNLSTSQGELAHGYTSDESNTSANSTTKAKSRRHISRSILERAKYWEKRAEQGLLSDASVNEEFPGIELTPD